MGWHQSFETDSITSLDGLETLVSGLQTAGEVESIELQINATKPIYHQPPDTLTAEPTTETTPTSTTEEPETTSTSTTENVKSGKHKYSTQSPSGVGSVQTSTATDGGDSGTTTASTSDTTPTHSPDTPATTETTSSTNLRQKAQKKDREAVKYRKWPRVRQELGIDTEARLPAVAYPGEIEEFHGSKDADVEHNTPYKSRVNGTVEYGAFVTLDGTGYNPKSKYQEVSGLLHNDNMLDDHDNWSFSQGDDVIVELISHSEKGLSFRELYELDEDDAKEARYKELVRLHRLDLEEGDQVTFSDWPTERESKGTVENIDMGRDDPATPPTIEINGSGTTEATVRPSEIVATANPVATNTDSVEDPDPEDVGMATATEADDEEEEPTTNTANAAPTVGGMSASPAVDLSEVEPDEDDEPAESDSNIEEEESQDGEELDEDTSESDEEQEEFPCLCDDGPFDTWRARAGHWTHCHAYQSWSDDHDDDVDFDEWYADTDDNNDTPERAGVETTNDGTVVNPILLDTKYGYTQVAVTLYHAPGHRVPTSTLASMLEDTKWEMGRANIESHLGLLRDKDVVAREKDGNYQYFLTDRGEAGVEKVLDENDSYANDVPDFN